MGDTADNVADGLAGDDVLSAFAGNDTLLGGSGNDTLDGGVGDDQLDGGDGADTASYAGISRDVAVDLDTGTSSGAAGNDTLVSIENVTGGTGNDQITGDGQDNTLDGGAGDDVLDGRSGDDVLLGGSGSDTADYGSATSGVNADLSGGTATGGAGNDTLIGIENVAGSAHDDTLQGDGGANTLDGNAGNDVLEGGAGDDELIGDEGVDTALYSNATAGVAVNLTTGVASGGEGSDTLSGIENVVGSNHNDVLTGSDGANVLTGGGGDDVLVGGQGDDVLDGGIGLDTAYYTDATDSVTVSLALGESAGAAGHDTLLNVENVTGGSGHDQITGDAQENTLHGGEGNDVLDGGAGDDALYGDAGSDTVSYGSATSGVDVNLAAGTADGGGGHDTLSSIESVTGSNYDDVLIGNIGANRLDGGTGDDNVEGGAGDDTLIGGAGMDTVHYDHAASAVNVNLSTGAASGGGGSDSLSQFEHVVGSDFNDTLTGDGGANTLSGGLGNDTLDGGLGNDVLDGGAGTDTASYASMASTVNVNLATGVATGAAGTDTLAGIENIVGGSGYDVLTGDDQSNTLQGGSGNDTLDGGLGDDTLVGGSGTDTASYAGASGGVSANLSSGSVTGAAGNDALSGIENVTGSAYDDSITGDANANVFVGGAGNDTIDGGSGNDTIEGGLGDDTLLGGTGTDTLRHSSAAGGVTADLTNGTVSGAAGSDSISGFENVTGSYYADTIQGDANANTLSGSGGDDVLDGRAGNDTLDGGTGNDVLVGGGGTDTASYSGASGAVTVDLANGTTSGAAGNDTLSGIENVTGSYYNDTLLGDDGNNVLVGGSGNDNLDGRGGTDTANYSSTSAGVDVNLAQGTATGSAGNDTLANIENVTGGSGADTLTGDDGNNVLNGGSGNDVLIGGLGKDTLNGGSGTDVASYADASGSVTVDLSTNKVTGAADSDTLVSIENVQGSEYGDVLTGNSSANTLEGGAGNDTLNGGGGTDTASYANATGAVTADLSSGTSSGAAGEDTLLQIENLSGSAYDDTLAGDANANVLTGGLGDDALDGGAGVDTASYAGASGAVTVDLAAGTASGAAGNDTLVNIENLAGSDYADDLTGDDAANTLSGGAGNDILDGGLGNDTLDGGAGTDTASYAGTSGAVTVNLAAGQATGAAGSDTLTAVENVTGSEYGDILAGDANANVLLGGSGDDRLDGGAGNDTLDGGAGHDTADYSTASSAVSVDLTKAVAQSTGGSGTDTLVSIESVIGSNYNDTFAFSQPTDGAHYTVDGGGGANTIDLSSFSRADASIDKAADTVIVNTADGQHFTIDYSNIASLKFTDGTVLTTDTAPVASAGDDQNVAGGAFVTLDASTSQDADGDLLHYTWTQTSGPSVELSSASAVSPTFTAPDGYVNMTLDFQVEVSDGTHVSTDSAQVVINRDDFAPKADAGPDQGVTEGDVVSLEGNGTDPLGNGLTYEWIQLSGPTVELSDAHDPNPTFLAPELDSSEPVRFELHVSDGTKTSVDTVDVFVNAVDDGPTASAGPDQVVEEHAIVSLNGQGSTDPDSPSLSYQWTQVSGPGVELSDSTSSQPTFEAPNATNPTVLTFELQVSDGHTTHTDTVDITVNPTNGAPNAQADEFATVEDTASHVDATHGVLANDTDLDGDTLSASLTQDAEHGQVVLNADGSFTYTPEADFSGTDTFTYQVSDGQGGQATATATVSVTPANDAPVAGSDSHTVDEDGTLNVDATHGVLANDTDLDGDTLSASLTQDAEHGQVVLNADGSFTYTPEADFSGTDTFTYQVSDGQGGQATTVATIAVNEVEDASAAPDAEPDDSLAPVPPSETPALPSDVTQSPDVLVPPVTDAEPPVGFIEPQPLPAVASQLPVAHTHQPPTIEPEIPHSASPGLWPTDTVVPDRTQVVTSTLPVGGAAPQAMADPNTGPDLATGIMGMTDPGDERVDAQTGFRAGVRDGLGQAALADAYPLEPAEAADHKPPAPIPVSETTLLNPATIGREMAAATAVTSFIAGVTTPDLLVNMDGDRKLGRGLDLRLSVPAQKVEPSDMPKGYAERRAESVFEVRDVRGLTPAAAGSAPETPGGAHPRHETEVAAVTGSAARGGESDGGLLAMLWGMVHRLGNLTGTWGGDGSSGSQERVGGRSPRE